MHKILITGGSGFLGSNLVNYLSAKKYVIYASDNNFRGLESNLKKKSNIVFKKIDIRNKSKLEKVVSKVDTIIHLAFINGTNYFYEKPNLVLDVGIKGTMNVIELANKFKNVKNFLFASSSEVYQTPKSIPTDEMTECKVPDVKNPRYSYGASKLIGEIMTLHLLNDNIRKIIFRPHNIYGKNMGLNHVIPEVISRIKILSQNFKKKKITLQIQGTGKESRSFCHVDDAVRQIEKILIKGRGNEIYNVGTMEQISIKKLIKIICNLKKIKINIKSSILREGSTKKRCPKMNKTFKLGYKSKIKIYDGLKKII